MSTYVVKLQFPYDDAETRFGVFHSTSGTMFAPTFGENEELAAHMFAAHFEANRGAFCDYSERAQEKLLEALRAFTLAYGLLEDSSLIHAPWLATWGEQHNNPEPSDVADLIYAFERTWPVADLLMAQFHAWQQVRA